MALCTTIHHATQLRRICIRNGDDIFLKYADLTKAIALLNHLEHLDVTSKQPSHTLLLALSDLQAKLITVKLVFDTPYSSSQCNQDAAVNPISILRHSCSTLRRIVTRNIVLSNWADTIHPKVTHVDASLVRLPLTRSLAAAMPNLTNLRVEDTYGDAGKLFDVPTASRRRAENTDTSLSKDAPNWSRLDCVTGPIIDVFSLGLTCPVSRLCLHTTRRGSQYFKNAEIPAVQMSDATSTASCSPQPCSSRRACRTSSSR